MSDIHFVDALACKVVEPIMAPLAHLLLKVTLDLLNLAPDEEDNKGGANEIKINLKSILRSSSRLF